jgi:UDP-2,4-diacetamido-2,4,6-trideoxy-beta-L-altropyranose hydrolase
MNIVFLTEGGKKIGTGHINRCVALADGFSMYEKDISFIVRGGIDTFPLDRDYFVRYTEWFDQEILNEILKNHEIVVVDSYQATDSLLRFITENNRNVVFLIDSTQKFHSDGIIFFPSVYAGNEKYRQTLASVKKPVLSGLKYLLYSKEFWGIDRVEVRPKILKIGISLGSSEIKKLDDILDLLGQIFGIEISVKIFGTISEMGKPNEVPFQCEVLGRLEKEKYVKNLSMLDLLICSGGQTLNEALLMGLPTLSLITADNQAENIREWDRLGLTVGIEAREGTELDGFEKALKKLSSREIRERLNKKTSDLIDTNGAKRAAAAIVDLTKTN